MSVDQERAKAVRKHIQRAGELLDAHARPSLPMSKYNSEIDDEHRRMILKEIDKALALVPGGGNIDKHLSSAKMSVKNRTKGAVHRALGRALKSLGDVNERET